MAYINIKEIIKAFKLPKKSKFMGFVVHLPDSDEFLAFSEEKDGDMELRAFSKTPDHAHIFKDYEKALSESKSCSQWAIVCILIDMKKQWIVVSYDDWIKQRLNSGSQ